MIDWLTKTMAVKAIIEFKAERKKRWALSQFVITGINISMLSLFLSLLTISKTDASATKSNATALMSKDATFAGIASWYGTKFEGKRLPQAKYSTRTNALPHIVRFTWSQRCLWKIRKMANRWLSVSTTGDPFPKGVYSTFLGKPQLRREFSNQAWATSNAQLLDKIICANQANDLQ